MENTKAVEKNGVRDTSSLRAVYHFSLVPGKRIPSPCYKRNPKCTLDRIEQKVRCSHPSYEEFLESI